MASKIARSLNLLTSTIAVALTPVYAIVATLPPLVPLCVSVTEAEVYAALCALRLPIVARHSLKQPQERHKMDASRQASKSPESATFETI